MIPRWVDAMLRGVPVVIHGDGETTRDFCYVDNVVQANLLAATTTTRPEALNQVYNVAVGGRMSLNDLFAALRELLAERHPALPDRCAPIHDDFRPGDVRHSQADISKATRLLGYEATHDVRSGLREALPWYEARSESRPACGERRRCRNARGDD